MRLLFLSHTCIGLVPATTPMYGRHRRDEKRTVFPKRYAGRHVPEFAALAKRRSIASDGGGWSTARGLQRGEEERSLGSLSDGELMLMLGSMMN